MKFVETAGIVTMTAREPRQSAVEGIASRFLEHEDHRPRLGHRVLAEGVVAGHDRARQLEDAVRLRDLPAPDDRGDRVIDDQLVDQERRRPRIVLGQEV